MTCSTCDGSGIEKLAEYEFPCSCVCVYDHQPGSPSFEGGAAFEAYQNQQERDLTLYGNSFSVDGVRVHPSEVKIDTDCNCFVGIDLGSKPSVTSYWANPNFDRMSRRETEEALCIYPMKFTTEKVVVDDDGGYVIPENIIESFRKWIDAEIIKSISGQPTPEPPPVTPACGCPSYSILHRHNCNAWIS